MADMTPEEKAEAARRDPDYEAKKRAAEMVKVDADIYEFYAALEKDYEAALQHENAAFRRLKAAKRAYDILCAKWEAYYMSAKGGSKSAAAAAKLAILKTIKTREKLDDAEVIHRIYKSIVGREKNREYKSPYNQ